MLQRETASKPELLELTAKYQSGEAPTHLSFVDGLIYFHCSVLVTRSSAVKRLLLEEHHSTLLARHPVVSAHFAC